MIKIPAIPGLARESLIAIAGCVIALFVLTAVGLLPGVHKSRHQNRAVSHIQARLDEQKKLNDIYRKFVERAVVFTEMDSDSQVKPELLPADKIDDLFAMIQEVADREGVALDTVRPAVRSGNLSAGRVFVRAVFRGRLDQHRPLLKSILREPYVADLEKLTLQGSSADVVLQVVLAINVA